MVRARRRWPNVYQPVLQTIRSCSRLGSATGATGSHHGALWSIWQGLGRAQVCSECLASIRQGSHRDWRPDVHDRVDRGDSKMRELEQFQSMLASAGIKFENINAADHKKTFAVLKVGSKWPCPSYPLFTFPPIGQLKSIEAYENEPRS